MNRKRLVAFVVAAYGISWLIWLPNVLAHNFDVRWEMSNWLHIAGGLGPFLGAIITTYLFDKKDGLVRFLRARLFALPDAR